LLIAFIWFNLYPKSEGEFMKSRFFITIPTLLIAAFFTFADEQSTNDKNTQTQDVPACCAQTDSKDAHKDCKHEEKDTYDSSKTETSEHQHHADIDRRGDEVMGFDHTRTTHHFYLKPDGGIIQVTANSSTDSESKEKIRTHLQEISTLFKKGDFSPAKQIHDREPSGASLMTQLKDTIDYSYEEVSDGARIVIHSKNEEAQNAIHEFLKFQIQDHRTGDPLNVQP
jgi:hypothetical protein